MELPMHTLAKLTIAGITLAVAIFAGFWWGYTQSQTKTAAISHQTNNFDKKILYYRNPFIISCISGIR